MNTAQIYLPPVFTMVALSFLIALSILITRSGDLLAKRKSVAYYEDWDGTGASVFVMRPTRQLTSLFEFPVLFYAAVAMIIAVGLQDFWMPKLCWAYVALRWMHAFIHIFINRLWVRTPVFMLGQFVLLGIWMRLGFVVFG